MASTWACERFQDYLLGLPLILEMDHKPLVSLLGSKDLDQLPARVQRMSMRLMRFTFEVKYTPGKDLHTADTLSRAPLDSSYGHMDDEMGAFINLVMEGLPATDALLAEIQRHQSEDEISQCLLKYVEEGWPSDVNQVNSVLRKYWQYQAVLNVVNGILMYGTRLFIPSSLRLEILARLHEGHLGIVKCKRRALQAVWWPGVTKEIEDMVKSCQQCVISDNQKFEPLIPSKFPDRPWDKVATDLMHLKGHEYLVVVDYYSRFIEVALLKDTLSKTVIIHLKSIFSRHGIPTTVISDNGPQYSSSEFAAFARDYGFHHVTSSPTHPSGNGEAERAVQTVKKLLKNADDPYAAMLSYRTTPLSNGYSPAELLMSRRLRTKVPVLPSTLDSKTPQLTLLREREEKERVDRAANFDARHRCKPLSELALGKKVFVPDRQEEGVVDSKVHEKSYVVKTPTCEIRRNRSCVKELPTGSSSEMQDVTPASPVKTRSGRIVKAPEKLIAHM